MKVHEWTMSVVATLLLVAMPVSAARAHAESDSAGIPAAGLQEDLKILERALNELHPGLHRYVDSASLAREFDILRDSFAQGAPLDRTYLEISRLLARIKCGHTYANFWNQPKLVQNELFHRADKVPFTFRILDGRMFVLADATMDQSLERGAEVVSLNAVSVREVLDALLPLIKADGSNDSKRLHDLQVRGAGGYEAFDVYYPLVFPVRDGRYDLEVRQPGSELVTSVSTEGVTREERRRRMTERYGAQPETPGDLWQFDVLDQSIAYLRLGTFVTWNMEMDWRKFLRSSFETMRDQNLTHLIIDIRGNEGGDDAVSVELAKHLATKPVQLAEVRQRMRYRRVPEDLNVHLDTWDDSFRDRGSQVVEVDGGFYEWRDAPAATMQLPPSDRAFGGDVYLLVDAANSSATFVLATMFKENQLATLVGQTTGGNRRGINGGQMFFLRLPNSRIEVDVPLIGYYRSESEPDNGLVPDVVVQPSARDLAAGIDAELQAALSLISRGR